MDKSIKEHKEFVLDQLSTINKSNFSKIKLRKKLKELAQYNRDATTDFQHERHIHLLVTLFFAFLTIFFAVLVFVLNYICSYDINFQTLSILAAGILIMLLITEVFYIFHYFKLENGTQSLYNLSRKIFESIDKIDVSN